MLKKKTAISILLLICIFLISFSGCGNSPADNSSPDLSLTEHKLPDRMDADFAEVLNYFVAKADRILHNGEEIAVYLPYRIDFGNAVTVDAENISHIDTSLLDKSDTKAYDDLGRNSTNYDNLRYVLMLNMLLAYYDGCYYTMPDSSKYVTIGLAPKYSSDKYESVEACMSAAGREFDETGVDKNHALYIRVFGGKRIITAVESNKDGEELYPKAVELSVKALQDNNK